MPQPHQQGGQVPNPRRDPISFVHLDAIRGTLATTPITELAQAYGIHVDDIRLVMQKSLWRMQTNRIRIRQTIESLISGSLDMWMLPKWEVPVQLIAAWIAVIVSPCNWMIACGLFDHPRTAEAIAADPDHYTAFEGVTPARLFAIIWQCADENKTSREKMNRAILTAIEGAQEE